MSQRRIVAAGAEDDIDVAYRWYEERTSGLRVRFLDELERCFQRVSLNPTSYPEVETSDRRALPRVFP
jgi:plasmid stabilization system protein ParE